MPDWAANAFLHLLPFAEILVGLMLVLGLFTRVAGLLASVMLVCYMIAVTGVWNKPGWNLQLNLVLITIAVMVLMLGPGSISVDRSWKPRAPAKD
jgi:uncharacterized membrane protein YphA (DoxX/SURF4 family)